jgi:DNA-binding IclR family transcriptional regulator
VPTLVPASARTLSVFEVFARERRELSNSDLARLLDLPESSCSDLLYTLHQLGYLMRTVRTRRFYPTSRLFAMAREITKNDPLYVAGSEAIEILSEKTGETAFCGCLDNGAVKILAAQEGRFPLRYILQIGERIALNGSALGKALLGLLDPKEAARQLRLKPARQITPATITDLAKLERQIRTSSQRGWASSEGEGSEGVSALAVAGFIGGEPIALSLAGPSDRFKQNRDAYVNALQEIRQSVFANQAGG